MKSNDKGQNDKEKWTFNESFHLKKKFKKRAKLRNLLSFRDFIEVNIP